VRSAILAALLTLAAVSHGAELRTLFHSAEERAKLDRLRRGESAEPQGASVPRVPVVGGFVRRSDGRTTVWLDGKPVTMSDAAAAAYLEPSKARERERRPGAIDFRRTK
jgi:hypothetical protein